MAPKEIEAHFLELLKGFKTGTLITRALGGGLHGRPMAIGEIEENGTVWFLTDHHSGKVAEIARDTRALVSFADSDRYMVMNGEITLLRDGAKAHAIWKEPFRVWFQGPDDPNLALLRFEPEDGEYWNNAGVQGIKQAFRAARAYLQGDQLKDVEDPGIHGRVVR